MTKKNSPIWKVLKIILILVLIGAAAYMALVVGSVFLLFKATSDHTDLHGDIIIPESELYIGEPIPIEFIPAEGLEEIHGLMWDVYFTTAEGQEHDYDYLLEGQEILEEYTQSEVNALFGKTIDDINRVTIYTPTKSGNATIDLAGFYRQTNPQVITEIEVMILEK